MSKVRRVIRSKGIGTDAGVCVDTGINENNSALAIIETPIKYYNIPDCFASLAMTVVARSEAMKRLVYLAVRQFGTGAAYMFWAARGLIVALSLCAVAALSVGCANPADATGDQVRFTFSVADVGQGLAQIGIVGKRAVLWDVGDDYRAWRAAYVNLGSPRVESVIISHSDEDHYKALASFDARVDWGGEIVVSPYEDTALLRKSAGVWADRVTFKHCSRGDTLRTLNPVAIVCLWPPPDLDVGYPIKKELKNRYSLVFSVRHGSARALITSDIDSAAMKEIAVHSAHDLRAELLIAPHHGSAGSVNPLFFSYAAAQTAVISCARDNSYGHPSPRMIDELEIRWRVKIRYTFTNDTTTFVSNGYYFF